VENPENWKWSSARARRYKEGLVPDDSDIPFFDEIMVVNEFDIINPGYRMIDTRLDQLARPKACPQLDWGARATRNG